MRPKMIKSLVEVPLNRSLFVHAAAAILTLVGFSWVKSKLDASYEASKHPVDYFTGQTGFSAEKIKTYYAQMTQTGTLDVYWQTQMIDFGFIIAMFCIGLFVCTFIAHLGRAGSWGRYFGQYAGLGFMFGAVSDCIENLWSFVMLVNPTDFANWLAFPYSGFAVLKFFLITLGLAGITVSLITSILGRVFGKPVLG